MKWLRNTFPSGHPPFQSEIALRMIFGGWSDLDMFELALVDLAWVNLGLASFSWFGSS